MGRNMQKGTPITKIIISGIKESFKTLFIKLISLAFVSLFFFKYKKTRVKIRIITTIKVTKANMNGDT